MKYLKAALMLSGIGALLCVCALSWQLSKLVTDSRTLVQETAGAVQGLTVKSNLALEDTHRLLLEAGLTAKEARLAAKEQRAYWDKISEQSELAIQKANRVLDSVNKVTLDTDASQQALTAESVETLRQMQETLKESQRTLQASTEAIKKAGDSAGDPSIALALQHLNGTLANVELTSKRVDETVARLTKPQSLIKSVFKSLFDLAWKSKTLVK